MMGPHTGIAIGWVRLVLDIRSVDPRSRSDTDVRVRGPVRLGARVNREVGDRFGTSISLWVWTCLIVIHSAEAGMCV